MTCSKKSCPCPACAGGKINEIAKELWTVGVSKMRHFVPFEQASESEKDGFTAIAAHVFLNYDKKSDLPVFYCQSCSLNRVPCDGAVCGKCVENANKWRNK